MPMSSAPAAGAGGDSDERTNSSPTGTARSAPMKTESFRMWEKESPLGRGVASYLSGMADRIRTRFLVIGSGVAGLHTAWRASEHGDGFVVPKRSLFHSATP